MTGLPPLSARVLPEANPPARGQARCPAPETFRTRDAWFCPRALSPANDPAPESRPQVPPLHYRNCPLLSMSCTSPFKSMLSALIQLVLDQSSLGSMNM